MFFFTCDRGSCSAICGVCCTDFQEVRKWLFLFGGDMFFSINLSLSLLLNETFNFLCWWCINFFFLFKSFSSTEQLLNGSLSFLFFSTHALGSWR